MLNEEQAWVFTGCLFVALLALLWSQSRWHLFQGTVFAVVTGGIAYAKWTANPYAAAFVGGMAAYVGTGLLLWLIDKAKGRGHRLPSHQGGQDNLTKRNRIPQGKRHLLRSDG